MSIAAASKKFIPKKLRALLASRRQVEGARHVHRQLRQNVVELQERHLRNLKVVPQRNELLRRMPQGGIAAEVGVAEGEFSQEILDILQPDELHLIDLWQGSDSRYDDAGYAKVQKRFQTHVTDGRVHLHRQYSWDGLAEFANGSLDFVYIDASHRYEDVARDLAAALPKMKPTGIIAGHDYITWSDACSRFGVIEAVNEFCVNHDFEMILLTNQSNRHLSYALRKIVAEESLSAVAKEQ